MADYTAKLKSDLVSQFRDKPVIDALMEAIGAQLTDLSVFFEDLKTQRGVQTAVGKQLDGVGDMVVLSRKEASELACISGSIYSLEDEEYRKYLIYKIWKNNCNCTYPDILKAFRMFWELPLYYSEDPDYPATIFLESGDLSPEDNAEKLLNAPFIKAAGVAIRVTARTVSPEMVAYLGVRGTMGRGYMSTTLPELPFGDFDAVAAFASRSQNIMQTTLPEMEESQ